MSIYYSRYDLNTYLAMPYFRAHVPDGFPINGVMIKSRSFRKLPPRIRKLAALAKKWACRINPDIPEGWVGIEQYYDPTGHELDPETGVPLTDEEIDSLWNPDDVPKDFVVKDIPLPPGGFADPDTWEEPTTEPDEPDKYDGPTEESLLNDIEARGRKYTAEYYGLPLDQLSRAKTDEDLASLILDMLSKPQLDGPAKNPPKVPPSPFAKSLNGYHRKDRGQPCEQGETTKTGCIPKKKEPGKTPTRNPQTPQPKPASVKKPAAVGRMAEARREGKGKEARIVMADGSPTPAHIKPSMVPPDWIDVKVGLDPSADVLVTARDNKGRTKKVYSDQFHMRNAAVKFGRIKEAMDKHNDVWTEVQQARYDPKTAEEADCFWLIMGQGTRPGSAGDTKARVKAYGATTLEGRHVVEHTDGSVWVRFVGKEGVKHNHRIRDERVARMLKERATAAGKDGKLFNTNDNKLRDFVAKLDGGGFLTKDFRTLLATRLAAQLIEEANRSRHLDPSDQKAFKKAVKEIAEKVSSVLGNKPAQAIESYIMPELWGELGKPPAYEKGATNG